jgi:hypothetical protein
VVGAVLVGTFRGDRPPRGRVLRGPLCGEAATAGAKREPSASHRAPLASRRIASGRRRLGGVPGAVASGLGGVAATAHGAPASGRGSRRVVEAGAARLRGADPQAVALIGAKQGRRVECDASESMLDRVEWWPFAQDMNPVGRAFQARWQRRVHQPAIDLDDRPCGRWAVIDRGLDAAINRSAEPAGGSELGDGDLRAVLEQIRLGEPLREIDWDDERLDVAPPALALGVTKSIAQRPPSQDLPSGRDQAALDPRARSRGDARLERPLRLAADVLRLVAHAGTAARGRCAREASSGRVTSSERRYRGLREMGRGARGRRRTAARPSFGRSCH